MARDTTVTTDTTLLHQIFDFASRANPYPLWTKLRQTPVCWQEDGPDEAGTYVVSTYREIAALLHDPRLSSEFGGGTQSRGISRDDVPPLAFLNMDPPEHDTLRRLTMRYFGPPERPHYLEQLRPEIERVVTELLDQLQGESQFDLVERFTYPLPVTMICRILGVPREDESKFRVWSDAVAEGLSSGTEAERRKRAQGLQDLHQYMAGLIEQHRKQPGDDMLSRMATDTGPDGPMTDPYLITTATLLLIAGHETTVNLIDNGMLTLLRYPDVLDRLRSAPELIPGAVEEMLRYEPPVQFLANRHTLDEISVAGTTIPKGVILTLALAAGNRDPARFTDPDRFDPERRDNEHLGFGGGIHSCFGAPLARVEAQVAFRELLRRLEQPRLMADPPPYRPSPVLRGPRQLMLNVSGMRESSRPAAHSVSR